MSFKLRHLRLRTETLAGTYGADIPFETGLNVLWADNTMGKSTCLQAVIYALGLERMLSSRREIPLTYVMTSHLDDPETGEQHNVLESSVWLELENGRGEILTIRRTVKSDIDPKLISVFSGPALTDPAEHFTQRDYFVLDPGAAQREAGFHRMFVDFVGWTLPRVKRYDGGETTLYLETLFPLFYVEQKAGWSAVPAVFPTYFQIREVGRRALEFIMGMDTHELELKKQQLELDIAASKAAWVVKRDEIQALARLTSGRVEGIASTPMLSVAEIERAALLLPDGDSWRTLAQESHLIRNRVADLAGEDVPTVSEIAPELVAEINALTTQIASINAERNNLFRLRQIEIAQREAALVRLASLDDDLKKNQDAQKIQRLGSLLGSNLVLHHCPTCEQPLADTLLPQRAGVSVMPVEDNIEYIKAQKAIFNQVSDQSAVSIQECEKRLAALTEDVNARGFRLRALRADLTAPANAASISAIEQRLRLETRLQTLEDVQLRFGESKLELQAISSRHKALLDERNSLPDDRFSEADKTKLTVLTRLIREQAAAYGFTTFPANEIDIAEDTFRPEKQGFEIGFELSASDAIRLKWAYQLALLELSRNQPTNHPGVLFFDEPRQQETKKASVQHLFERAVSAKDSGQQVIFATSEDREQVEGFLRGLSCSLVAFDGKIVQRIR